MLGLILAARGARALRERRGGMITLSYPNGVNVRVPKGLSVLEASLRNNLPHASVCGGKARCSTCRIRISAIGRVAEPSRREQFVLDASAPAATRPCASPASRARRRTSPSSSSFRRTWTRRSCASRCASGSGEERYVVSMFVDMRRSTALAEARLPFDTMFIINRFVAAVSSAVEDAGGRPNQFVGDGILALFGLDASPSIACSQAINSIGKIAANVAQLNRDLAGDLREPIQYGIGLNGGNVIIGDIGYREHIVFTALGDPVNVRGASAGHDQGPWVRCAHRRGDLRTAGLAPDASSTREISIRGRDRPMMVRLAERANPIAAATAFDGTVALPG